MAAKPQTVRVSKAALVPCALPLNDAVDTLAQRVKDVATQLQKMEEIAAFAFAPGCSRESLAEVVQHHSALRGEAARKLMLLEQSTKLLYHSLKGRAEESGSPSPLRERNVITLGGGASAEMQELSGAMERIELLMRQLCKFSEAVKRRPFRRWSTGYAFLERRRTCSPVHDDHSLPQESFTAARFLASGHSLPDGRRIGGGSFGKVSRVKCAGTTFAVKRFFQTPDGRGSFDLSGAAAAGARAVAQSRVSPLSVEEKMLGLVSGVPGVLPLLGVVDEETLLLPLAEKGSVLDLLKRGEQLTKGQLRELVKTFDQLHKMGIVHRDIKSENIVVMDDGSLKVIDFGYAREVKPEEILPKSAKHVGTLQIMAPEVCRGEAYDPKKADVWSLGVVLFQIATGGRYPHQKPTCNHTPEGIPYMFAVANKKREPELERVKDADLRALISSMLQHDPTMRPSMEEALNHSFFNRGEPRP